MARTLRIGIIGCGKIAHVDHVPHYLRLKNVEIVSLLDIKRSQIGKLKQAIAMCDAIAKSGRTGKFAVVRRY